MTVRTQTDGCWVSLGKPKPLILFELFISGEQGVFLRGCSFYWIIGVCVAAL